MKNNYKYLYDILGSNITCDNHINFVELYEIGESTKKDITYTFFNDINILVSAKFIPSDNKNNKEKIDKLEINIISPKSEKQYKLHYYKKFINRPNIKNVLSIDDIDTNKVSTIIRGSETFKITKENSLFEKHLFFAICEKGCVLCDIYDNDERLNRITVLFMLAVAYNTKTEYFLEHCYNTYSKNKSDTNEIIKFRESIYEFSLKYFFELPVKEEKYETINIWLLIANALYVKQKYNEINKQVLDLTKIIVQNQEKEARERNEKSQQDKQAQDSKIQNNIAIIGLVIAFAPLIMDFFNLIVDTCVSFEYNKIIKLIIQFILIIFGILTVIKILKSEYIQNKLSNFLHTKKNE